MSEFIDGGDVVQASNLYVDHKIQKGPGFLNTLRALLDANLTDQEIAEKANMKHKTVSARRTEAARFGYVIPVDMRKMKRQRARVWQLTDEGRAFLGEVA
jgi:hypothetical protein